MVKRKGMKEAWCLATSLSSAKAEEVIKLYSRRFTIEESFRDEKDDRFGLGLKEVALGTPGRRDRMLLVVAIARVFLTLLGKAGEDLGLDRQLRANTRRAKRTHSLLNQGKNYARGAAVGAAVAQALTLSFVALLAALPQATATFWTI